MPRNDRLMLSLFALLAAALALATHKLPFFSVSITAPIFAWIFIEAATRRAVRLPALWLWLASLFWFGLLASLAGNIVLGDLGSLGRDELVLLARYTFWLTLFVATAALTSQAQWTPKLMAAMAAAAGALALMRLANQALGGELWLHQNECGLRFSAFAPFLIAACLARGGLGSVGALSAVAAAVLVNGSRSSWIALAAAGFAMMAIRGWAGRSLRGPLLALCAAPVLLAGCAALGPPGWSQPIVTRWESLSRLESDKPFQTRLALIEKGRLLFERNPFFGAGLGRFDLQRVRLAAARTPWANDQELNQRSSHNAYLSLLAETGLAGSVSFAALLVALLVGGARAAYRLMRRGEDWAAGVWASSLALSIHLAALSGLTGTLPWFVFGLTAGMIERERRGVRP